MRLIRCPKSISTSKKVGEISPLIEPRRASAQNRPSLQFLRPAAIQSKGLGLSILRRKVVRAVCKLDAELAVSFGISLALDYLGLPRNLGVEQIVAGPPGRPC